MKINQLFYFGIICLCLTSCSSTGMNEDKEQDALSIESEQINAESINSYQDSTISSFEDGKDEIVPPTTDEQTVNAKNDDSIESQESVDSLSSSSDSDKNLNNNANTDDNSQSVITTDNTVQSTAGNIESETESCYDNPNNPIALQNVDISEPHYEPDRGEMDNDYG